MDRLRFSFQKFTPEEPQAHCFLRVAVGDFIDLDAHANFNSKFLAQFPYETMFEAFAEFQFAAGELPKSAQMIAGPPLRNEKSPAAKHQACRDVDYFAHGPFG